MGSTMNNHMPQDRWLAGQIHLQQTSPRMYYRQQQWSLSPDALDRVPQHMETQPMWQVTLTQEAWQAMVRVWDEHHAQMQNPTVAHAWSQYVMVRQLCHNSHMGTIK
jgi:hypothetical protein